MDAEARIILWINASASGLPLAAIKPMFQMTGRGPAHHQSGPESAVRPPSGKRQVVVRFSINTREGLLQLFSWLVDNRFEKRRSLIAPEPGTGDIGYLGDPTQFFG